LRQEGQRISRHYYDLHSLMGTDVGQAALKDWELAADCMAHARMFFDRPDFDLASAKSGSFAIIPGEAMIDALRRDYTNTSAMIFGEAPTFDDILASIQKLDSAANQT
jgi:Nucleotidyl transferase AbiEii toxin, Type IV TA system